MGISQSDVDSLSFNLIGSKKRKSTESIAKIKQKKYVRVKAYVFENCKYSVFDDSKFLI